MKDENNFWIAVLALFLLGFVVGFMFGIAISVYL